VKFTYLLFVVKIEVFISSIQWSYGNALLKLNRNVQGIGNLFKQPRESHLQDGTSWARKKVPPGRPGEIKFFIFFSFSFVRWARDLPSEPVSHIWETLVKARWNSRFFRALASHKFLSYGNAPDFSTASQRCCIILWKKASSFTYSESTVILGDDNFTFFHLSILLIDDKTNWLKIPRAKFSFRVSKALEQP